MILTSLHDVAAVEHLVDGHTAHKLRRHVQNGHRVVWVPDAAAIETDRTLTSAERTFCHSVIGRGRTSAYVVRHA